MALYTKIPDDSDKIRQGIDAIQWQLKQDIPKKDRKIFLETLEVYRAALNGSRERIKKIKV